MSGEVNIGSTTLGQMPTCLPLTTSLQMSTPQSPWAVAMAAPASPPMRAWLEDDGSPSHQVNRFHAMAPVRAATSVAMVTTPLSTSPLLMVPATAVPSMAPTRLKKAARAMAWRGVRTLVETTVAMALAASWKPLMYSNTKAASRTMRKSVMARRRAGRARARGAQEYFRTIWKTTLPASRQRSTAFSNISKSSWRIMVSFASYGPA